MTRSVTNLKEIFRTTLVIVVEIAFDVDLCTTEESREAEEQEIIAESAGEGRGIPY